MIGGATVRGIFDNGYSAAFGDIAGSQPFLLLPTASVGLAVPGDSITVAGTSYTIAESQPDGTGMSRLILEAV